MLPAGNSKAGPSFGRLFKLVLLLWLAGVAMRMTILAMPPVIPLVHRDLQLSETEVGLIVGLPLALFALAAVPGSLLISRIGTKRAVIAGMLIAALASAARGAAIDVWTLYAAAIATGFGVAIMQPGVPTLVREWLPHRIALGTVAYTAGMLIGSMCAAALTIPLMLPLVGGSWRLDLLCWAALALLIVPVFAIWSPAPEANPGAKLGGRWWPDWRNPLVWLLGLTFGSNNAPFFTTNAFLGDYLASAGRAGELASAMAWLNGAQIVAPFMLLMLAERLQQRAWPFLLFGPLLLVAFLGLAFAPSTSVIALSAGLVGLTTAVTLTATLALPPLLAAPADLPRTAAGMFTISYTTAIVVPTLSGALWDGTGRPWTIFIPLGLCAVTLTVLGTAVTRYKARGEPDDHASEENSATE